MASSITEELLILKSIFCAPNEIQIRFDGALIENDSVLESSAIPSFNECEVQVTLLPSSAEPTHHHQGGVDVKFKLSNEYPLKPPHIILSCEFISNETVLSIAKNVEQFLKDEPRSNLYEAIEQVKTMLATLDSNATLQPPQQSTDTSNNNEVVSKVAEPPHYMAGTLIGIDHMRNQSMYIKTLRKWSVRYDVISTVVNFGLHNIYVQLLSNDERNIDIFMKQWRTQCIDVDSHGKPCKEHLLTIVSQSNQILMNDHQKYVLV